MWTQNFLGLCSKVRKIKNFVFGKIQVSPLLLNKYNLRRRHENFKIHPKHKKIWTNFYFTIIPAFCWKSKNKFSRVSKFLLVVYVHIFLLYSSRLRNAKFSSTTFSKLYCNPIILKLTKLNSISSTYTTIIIW